MTQEEAVTSPHSSASSLTPQASLPKHRPPPSETPPLSHPQHISPSDPASSSTLASSESLHLPPVLPKPKRVRSAPTKRQDSSSTESPLLCSSTPSSSGSNSPYSVPRNSPYSVPRSVGRNASIKLRAQQLERTMRGEGEEEAVAGDEDEKREGMEVRKEDQPSSTPNSPSQQRPVTRKPSRVAPPPPANGSRGRRTSSSSSSSSSADHTQTRSPELVPKSPAAATHGSPKTRSYTVAQANRRSKSEDINSITPPSSGSASPRLTGQRTPSETGARGPTSPSASPKARATISVGGSNSQPPPRPMLSKIKQKIAEKKELEAASTTTSPPPTSPPPTSPPPTSPPPVSPPATELSPGAGGGGTGDTPKRLSEIKRRLAEQKQVSQQPPPPPSPSKLPATPPADLAPPTPPPKLIPPVAPKLAPAAATGGQNIDTPVSLPPRTVSRQPPQSQGSDSTVANSSTTEAGTRTAAARTKDQKQEDKEVDSDASKKRFRSIFGKKKNVAEVSTKQPSSNKSPKRAASVSPERKVTTRAKFLNMSVRPLPALPSIVSMGDRAVSPSHTEHDYEKFMDDNMVSKYPPRSAPSVPSLSAEAPSPSTSSATSASPVRRWQSFNVQDTKRGGVLPQISGPPPPPLPPHRSKKNVPMYIEGYVNSDGIPMPAPLPPRGGDIDSRPPLEVPAEPPADAPDQPDGPEPEEPLESDDEAHEYDYPNLCGAGIFRSLPAKKKWFAKLEKRIREERIDTSLIYNGAQQRVKALRTEDVDIRSRTVSDASSDYVPMDGSARDDTYVNYNAQTLPMPPRHRDGGVGQTHPPDSAPTERQYAADDISVYMNLPVPDKPTVTASLPPRTLKRHQEQPPPTSSSSSSSAVTDNVAPAMPPSTTERPAPQAPPPPAPKPKMLRTASDNIATTTTAPPTVLPKPTRTKPHPPTTMVAAIASQLSGPSPGWRSPNQSSEQSPTEPPQQPDYANFDVSQSLPASSGVSTKQLLQGQGRRVSDESLCSKLPPRDILRHKN